LRYQGRPIGELRAVYEATADAANPALVNWIESESQSGWPTLQPKFDPHRADQALEFGALIRAREAARVPAGILNAQKQLSERWHDITRIHLRTLAEGRHGPATHPAHEATPTDTTGGELPAPA
jgi:hypothetical protein